jgi:CheY-like chemotaxis protein
MAGATSSLQGLRILVVEDNFLVAEVIRDMLAASGCVIVGPVARLDEGVRLAGLEALDGAVLDVNLNGERCYPIARALRDRGVPYLFLTGYDDDSAMAPQELKPARHLSKPVLEAHLVEALLDIAGRRTGEEADGASTIGAQGRR